MTIEEAKELLKTHWTLKCGHLSCDIKNDYYTTFCGKCGCSVNIDKDRPFTFNEALRIVDEEYFKRRDARDKIQKSIQKDIEKFFKTNPLGTIEEFYNYIICEKSI